MAYITHQELCDRVIHLSEELTKLKKRELEYEVEEFSINKTTKLLHVGSSKVLHWIKSGQLNARIECEKGKKPKYKIRVADIRSFQEENQYTKVPFLAEDFETSEEIIKRIFKNERSKNGRL